MKHKYYDVKYYRERGRERESEGRRGEVEGERGREGEGEGGRGRERERRRGRGRVGDRENNSGSWRDRDTHFYVGRVQEKVWLRGAGTSWEVYVKIGQLNGRVAIIADRRCETNESCSDSVKSRLPRRWLRVGGEKGTKGM